MAGFHNDPDEEYEKKIAFKREQIRRIIAATRESDQEMERQEFYARLNLDPCDHLGHLEADREWRAQNPVKAAAEDARAKRGEAEFKEKLMRAEARRRTWIKMAAEMGIEPYFDYEMGQHLFRCVRCGASGEPFDLNEMGDIEADDDGLADILTVSVCEKCHPQAIEEE